MTISTRIRAARRAAGLSQSQLAELMNVTRSACSQWEQPQGTAPRGTRLERLATLLGVSVEWLATGNGEMDGRDRAADTRPSYRNALTDEERELLDAYAHLRKDGRRAVLALMREMRAVRRR